MLEGANAPGARVLAWKPILILLLAEENILFSEILNSRNWQYLTQRGAASERAFGLRATHGPYFDLNRRRAWQPKTVTYIPTQQYEYDHFADQSVTSRSIPVNGCEHPLLKQFTFSDGQTIKMCPDCPRFDEHRRAVLAGKPYETVEKVVDASFHSDTWRWRQLHGSKLGGDLHQVNTESDLWD
jgi:hypothetical protein